MDEKSNIELDNLEIYKQIVEHMNESLWIWDENNSTIFINNVFCELTWYSQDEIIWKNYYDFWDKESIEVINENNSKKKNLDKVKYEATIKSKSWELVPVLCSWTSTQNNWTVLIISNLKELKSLKQAEIDLIKINRTKDEFISIVWHELRTPLTSIRWYLSMILEWDMWKINEEVTKSLKHTYTSSIRLINLVNDVLSIGKIESGKMEFYMKDIKIKDLAKSVYRDIHLEIEKKWIWFNLDIDSNLEFIEINTDKDKLKQVLLNLLTNALKFTKEWWNITFKISKNSSKARFEIIDTWVWIPKDKLDILFNKFSQVESSMQRQNTSWLGLWLAISKSVLKEFNSEIKVESELDVGSNFYFDLELK
jgi:PAS domain S-box-containing protein